MLQKLAWTEIMREHNIAKMNYLLLAEHVAEPAAAALNYAVLAAALA